MKATVHKQPECPHCGSVNIELLPGGVVYECLELKCSWAFNGSEVIKWRTTEDPSNEDGDNGSAMPPS